MIETEGLLEQILLLRVLAHMGVDRIFSSPRLGVVAGVEAFAKAKAQSEGVRCTSARRHEEVAVGMASAMPSPPANCPPSMIHTTVARSSAHNGPARRASRANPHGRVHWRVTRIRRRSGPDVAPVARRSSRYRGPARLVDRCVKWRLRHHAKSLLPSTIQRALSTGDGTPKGPVFVSSRWNISSTKWTKNAAAEKCSASAPCRSGSDGN